jgi:hypothetical protein
MGRQRLMVGDKEPFISSSYTNALLCVVTTGVKEQGQ